MKKLAAILMAVLMLCTILTGCGKNADAPTTASTTAATEPTTEPTATSKYDEIFAKYHIVNGPAPFVTLDSASFAMETDNLIEKIEFGYEDNIVCELIHTVYYPVANWPDEDKVALDETMRETVAPYTALDFCTGTFNAGAAYYTLKLEFTGLDSVDHAAALQELGLIETDETSGLCHMSEAEAILLAQGYVKK